ncbi:MAG: hypothetical protein ABW278_03155 [Steroidobacteraceae bacterium]
MSRIFRVGALVVVMAGLLGGCGGDDDAETPPVVVTPAPIVPPPAPEWSAPTAVAPGGCPIESRDGAYLYTAAGPANTNGLDIWVLRRNAANNTYDSRTLLGDPVSVTTANDFCPTPLMGDWLMYVSTRDGAVNGVDKCGTAGLVPGLTGADLYLTRFAVAPPVTAGGPLQVQSTGVTRRLACYPDGPNTKGSKFSPSLLTTADGGFLFFSTEHNGVEATGSQNIYMSEMRPDGTYGPGVAVAALNTAFEDQQPNVSRDGLTIVFASNRDGNMDIFMSTRPTLDGTWSTPRNLSTQLGFPTASLPETRPSLSWDMKRLYYGADGQAYLSHKAATN